MLRHLLITRWAAIGAVIVGGCALRVNVVAKHRVPCGENHGFGVRLRYGAAPRIGHALLWEKEEVPIRAPVSASNGALDVSPVKKLNADWYGSR